jgi:tRNA 2-selenouridine synthase
MAISEHVHDAQAFLEAARDGVVLDVRSPSEFAKGHLPGSVSFPLFTDEERAAVGTTYKQVGKAEAMDQGLGLVGPKLRALVARARALFEGQSSRKPLLIYCWRGGMRSGSIDWLIRTSGIPTMRCDGGYKACRTHLNQVLEAPRSYVVLGGMTGSAKTEVLHALRKSGEEVVDLEGMARHFGSAFGNLDSHAQPSTEQFANDLAWRLEEIDARTSSTSRLQPIWVENESRQIGRVHVPETFHKHLRQAPVLELERTGDDRVRHLLSMYGDASRTALTDAFERIRTKLGGQHAQAAIAHVEAGELAEAARIALVYYDKTYRHGLDQRERMRAVDGRGLDPMKTAERCVSAHNEWNPWNLPLTSS